jgi:hypothetical protein
MQASIYSFSFGSVLPYQKGGFPDFVSVSVNGAS